MKETFLRNERQRGEDGRTNILPFRRKSELALAQIIGSSVHCSRFLKRNIYSFRFTLGSIFHIGFKTRWFSPPPPSWKSWRLLSYSRRANAGGRRKKIAAIWGLPSADTPLFLSFFLMSALREWKKWRWHDPVRSIKFSVVDCHTWLRCQTTRDRGGCLDFGLFSGKSRSRNRAYYVM